MWRRLFDPVYLPAVLAAIAATAAAAWLASWLAHRFATAGLRALVRDTLAASSPQVRRPIRLVATAAFVLVAAVLLFPALELAGLHTGTGLNLFTLRDWIFGRSGLKVGLIIVIAFVLVRTIGLLVSRFEYEMTLVTGLDALERAKRARTLGSVVRNATTALIAAIAVLMVLEEFKVNITPVLTGAGIVGLAVGFGAQALVRDIIGGFFLILENQVRVGDFAAINGTAGLVEAINLRTIVLRDIEGTVHVFPNGAINTLANRSKDYSYYVIDLATSYYEDPDRVAALLRETGAELQNDPTFGPSILEPVEILGVDAFTDWAFQMKLRIKTVPQKQWDVGRELRRRIVKAFEQQGLTMPFPVPASAVPPNRRELPPPA